MKVIESTNVDLIEPFPLTEIDRFIGWLHCYRTVMEVDGDPKTDEEKKAYYSQFFPQTLSWGVIDKNNSLGYKHEAPLIGIIFLQPGNCATNCYVHLASTRKAWGSGLMDEAGQKLIKHVFDTYPSLIRLSGAILNSNRPAKAFSKRMGFKQDGLMKDFVTQEGQPKSVAHFGLTRTEYNELCQPQQSASNQPSQSQELSTTN